jgi:hypothetical protein
MSSLVEHRRRAKDDDEVVDEENDSTETGEVLAFLDKLDEEYDLIVSTVVGDDVLSDLVIATSNKVEAEEEEATNVEEEEIRKVIAAKADAKTNTAQEIWNRIRMHVREQEEEKWKAAEILVTADELKKRIEAYERRLDEEEDQKRLEAAAVTAERIEACEGRLDEEEDQKRLEAAARDKERTAKEEQNFVDIKAEYERKQRVAAPRSAANNKITNVPPIPNFSVFPSASSGSDSSKCESQLGGSRNDDVQVEAELVDDEDHIHSLPSSSPNLPCRSSRPFISNSINYVDHGYLADDDDDDAEEARKERRAKRRADDIEASAEDEAQRAAQIAVNRLLGYYDLSLRTKSTKSSGWVNTVKHVVLKKDDGLLPFDGEREKEKREKEERDRLVVPRVLTVTFPVLPRLANLRKKRRKIEPRNRDKRNVRLEIHKFTPTMQEERSRFLDQELQHIDSNSKKRLVGPYRARVSFVKDDQLVINYHEEKVFEILTDDDEEGSYNTTKGTHLYDVLARIRYKKEQIKVQRQYLLSYEDEKRKGDIGKYTVYPEVIQALDFKVDQDTTMEYRKLIVYSYSMSKNRNRWFDKTYEKEDGKPLVSILKPPTISDPDYNHDLANNQHDKVKTTKVRFFKQYTKKILHHSDMSKEQKDLLWKCCGPDKDMWKYAIKNYPDHEERNQQIAFYQKVYDISEYAASQARQNLLGGRFNTGFPYSSYQHATSWAAIHWETYQDYNNENSGITWKKVNGWDRHKSELTPAKWVLQEDSKDTSSGNNDASGANNDNNQNPGSNDDQIAVANPGFEENATTTSPNAGSIQNAVYPEVIQALDFKFVNDTDTDISYYSTAHVRSGAGSFLISPEVFDITHKIKEARPKSFVPVSKFPDEYVEVVVDDAGLRQKEALKITAKKLENWKKNKVPKGTQLIFPKQPFRLKEKEKKKKSNRKMPGLPMNQGEQKEKEKKKKSNPKMPGLPMNQGEQKEKEKKKKSNPKMPGLPMNQGEQRSRNKSKSTGGDDKIDEQGKEKKKKSNRKMPGLPMNREQRSRNKSKSTGGDDKIDEQGCFVVARNTFISKGAWVLPSSTTPDTLRDVALATFKLMKKRDPDGVFAEPVSNSFAPSYSNIVKNPIDLATMKTKLNNGEYGEGTEGASKLYADYLLMFDNCKLYNGVNTYVTILAAELMTLLPGIYKRAVKRNRESESSLSKKKSKKQKIERLFTPATATTKNYWEFVQLVAGDEHVNPTTLKHGRSFICSICEGNEQRIFTPGSTSQVKRHVESEEHQNALQLIHGNIPKI